MIGTPESVPAGDVALGDVSRQVAELSDLFRRRLVEDRAKNELIHAVRQHLDAREALDSGAALEGVFLEMLLAVDRLEAEAPSAGLSASVSAELLEVLARRGLRLLPCEGMVDPLIHEIVGTQPASDDSEVGEIVAIRRRGYALGDRTIRPCQVIVAVDEAKAAKEEEA